MRQAAALLMLMAQALPTTAAPFDGDWKGSVPAMRGCAGGTESSVELLVVNGQVQGIVRNLRNDVAISGTLDDSGRGSVRVAQTNGTLSFTENHFILDWPGAAGCARHAEGARAPAPPIFADAPSQSTEAVVLFMAFCLQVYPDENALGDVMSRQGGVPLTAAEFKHLLPIEGKTGRGWTMKGSKGNYVLLVSQGVEPSMAERMPTMKARTCTLVTNGPAEMDPLPAFRGIKQQHAERKGIALLPPITNYKLPNSGAMEMQELGPASGIFGYSEVVKPETAPLKEFRMEFRQPE